MGKKDKGNPAGFKIESEYSKEEILNMYLNKIYLALEPMAFRLLLIHILAKMYLN